MEDELKAISAELAASIRREMDLEDLVDRLQAEISNPQAPGKRTSDYFSDSGYSSAKFSEYDASKEEVAQIQRRAEQEKAQIRLELTDKLTDERSRRKALDQQIKELGEKASQIDASQMSSRDADARVKELEKTCDDLRRRLSDERQVKDNFEDLLSALRGELQNAANERDNLRDEIVPQLRARVEGLEAQAADSEKLAYETTKMQQELQTLKSENTTLKKSQPVDDAITRLRSSSVTQQPFKLQQPPMGLSRSNTVARSSAVKGQTESREALSDRLKDVEAQRDALHSALKSLLERQEFQNRENEKKIRVLEVERDRLLSTSPRKAGYEKEVSNLREEINVLRRRAEEAIEQKWQVEKGLIGLKTDLDRAEEEIASLRALVKEKDILIPTSFTRSSAGSSTGDLTAPVTSASLERAYRELQDSYREALERIKKLEIGGSTTSAAQDEKTKLAMERLEQSLSAAIHERDDARQEAGLYRSRLESLEASEKSHMDNEQDLANQLRDSARRVEELAQQVRTQLATNATLRTRLSETVARGEVDQKISKERITNMQNRMRSLEEQIISAQSAAEDRVTRHEDELKSLKEAHNSQLQRLRDSTGGLKSPRSFPPKSPLSPLFSPGMKSPFLTPRPSPRRSSSMPGSDADKEEQLAQIDALKARVQDLERALSAADAEMQEVVGRMNTAQIEVLNLQEERENAVRETKKLQRLLEAEKVKAFQERFSSISGMVKA
ncbi:Intracellular protein transport-like protein [Pleurostoma richardsiae]|uniref:Intracellular protein transport-like protein n=1 Tax=Pleurostoma richardsiae TaxID=41990 RepID=A0AA38VBW7_9PEZI|nr:Intracellular protein transport-like protein [Pleurostoma richardsiae]